MNKLDKEKVYFLTDLSTNQKFQEQINDLDIDNLPAGFTVKVPVVMFREGKFKHPFYDDLVFDKDYLNRIVSNHKMGALPRQVSFDLDHRGFGGGAVAWIQEPTDLSLEDIEVRDFFGIRSLSAIVALATFNRKGIRLIADNEYKYFSAEIHPNYSTREAIVTKTQDGEVETVAQFGPVLVGGALTNHPFIPGMPQIMLSEDYENNSDNIIYPDNSIVYQDCGEGSMIFAINDTNVEKFKKLENQVVTTSLVNEQNFADEDEDTLVADGKNIEGDLKMKFSEFMKLLNAVDGGLGEQIVFAEANYPSLSDEDRDAVEAIVAAKRLAHEAELAHASAVQKYNSTSKEVERLTTRNVELLNDIREAKEGAWTARVEKFAADQTAEGHYPAVVSKVKEILLNSDVTAREYKFAESGGQVDLMQMFKIILDQIPNEGKMDFSEATSASSANEIEVTPHPQVAEPEGDTPKGLKKFADREGIGLDQIPSWSVDLIDENGILHWSKD